MSEDDARTYLYATTDRAPGALPNDTRVAYQTRKGKLRTGKVTGSQRHEGILLYCVAWDDRRFFPMMMEGDRLLLPDRVILPRAE